jgi:hypothetical protein
MDIKDIKDSSFYSVKIGDNDNVTWKGDRLRNYLIAHRTKTNIVFEKQSKLKKAKKAEPIIDKPKTKTVKSPKDIVTDALKDTNSN